nr:asparaginase [Actinomycetales bacterium]
MSVQQHFDDAELALVIRGGFRESYHRGIAVAVAADGAIVAALGNPDTPILPRSTL